MENLQGATIDELIAGLSESAFVRIVFTKVKEEPMLLDRVVIAALRGAEIRRINDRHRAAEMETVAAAALMLLAHEGRASTKMKEEVEGLMIGKLSPFVEDGETSLSWLSTLKAFIERKEAENEQE